MMQAKEEQLDPASLVARIISELEANPAAQKMLLRAMLTNEFLGMPARLDAIERDVAELKNRLATVEGHVAVLRGDSLEVKLPRRIRPYASQKFGLRRARIMLSPVAIDGEPALMDPLYDARDAGEITHNQEIRILATDLIMRALSWPDRSRVWVAVEASNSIGERDIRRARASADILTAIFGEDSIAVVAGYAISDGHQRLADELNVDVSIVEEN